MPECLGARLRRRREEQQISLSTIAEQTKISQLLLEALERDDVSRWPGGIFRRAFVRSYAQAIRLDPDVVVREFLERYPDPLEEGALLPRADAPTDAAVSGGPPTRLHHLVGAAFGSLSRRRPGPDQKRSGVEDSHASHIVAPDMSRPELPGDTLADARPVVDAPPRVVPDLSAAAHLCTELASLDRTHDVTPLLEKLAGVIHAIGLIVWVWDAEAMELRPALAYGYPDKVLAQLPSVTRDARNATAAAYRSARTIIVNGSETAHDAMVVPLMTAEGCPGVLAIELRHGGAQRESLRALATIFAAQIGRLVGAVQPEAARRRLA